MPPPSRNPSALVRRWLQPPQRRLIRREAEIDLLDGTGPRRRTLAFSPADPRPPNRLFPNPLDPPDPSRPPIPWQYWFTGKHAVPRASPDAAQVGEAAALLGLLVVPHVHPKGPGAPPYVRSEVLARLPARHHAIAPLIGITAEAVRLRLYYMRRAGLVIRDASRVWHPTQAGLDFLAGNPSTVLFHFSLAGDTIVLDDPSDPRAVALLALHTLVAPPMTMGYQPTPDGVVLDRSHRPAAVRQDGSRTGDRTVRRRRILTALATSWIEDRHLSLTDLAIATYYPDPSASPEPYEVTAAVAAVRQTVDDLRKLGAIMRVNRRYYLSDDDRVVAPGGIPFNR